MNAIGQISPNEWLQDSDIAEIFTLLDNQALFVGGCVRDALLGYPVKDIDLATKLLPEEVQARLNAAGIKTIPAGISFGMVMALTRRHNRAIEITTLRKDIATDGRHAVVSFGTDWYEDALRRDFTINAFYADKDGLVYDPLDNFEDLSAGRIRFIGNPEQRIKEDALRILRFFRFYAYYGHESMDKTALNAIKANAFMLQKLSKERIKEEFFKIIMSPRPDIILKTMEQSGVLAFIDKEIHDIPALNQLVWLETRGIVLKGLQPDLIRRLAVILPLSPDKIMAQKKNLRLSNLQKKRLCELSLEGEILAALKNIGILKTLYKYGKENVIDSLLLAFARQRAGACHLSFAEDEPFITLLEEASSAEIPQFPLHGADLKALGFSGKSLGEKLTELEKTWLDYNFSLDKNQLLEYVQKKV
ncbi:MAG: CCA tRNA nucleotidyltransferase [Alphaproteobacteria bacterium]|nr:CCA tRNA nucleotidyltransferase [Alphaproteobacteria bacterium]